MRYKDMTPEQREARREYMKQYRAEDKEYSKRIRKWRTEHRERGRKKQAEDVNSAGVTKHWIRVQSHNILFDKHTKLSGYEIHHCFGYEDPSKFIYIPKNLHIKIHQLLRDNRIPSDSNHWNTIRDLVNSCEEYIYIRT